MYKEWFRDVLGFRKGLQGFARVDGASARVGKVNE